MLNNNIRSRIRIEYPCWIEGSTVCPSIPYDKFPFCCKSIDPYCSTYTSSVFAIMFHVFLSWLLSDSAWQSPYAAAGVRRDGQPRGAQEGREKVSGHAGKSRDTRCDVTVEWFEHCIDYHLLVSLPVANDMWCNLSEDLNFNCVCICVSLDLKCFAFLLS